MRKKNGGVVASSLAVALLTLLTECASPRATSSPSPSRTPVEPSESFASSMDAAMVTMHQGMHMPYTRDPDSDFATMMIPHHQGAVDMAVLELRYGRDARLRRLAEGIIVEQRQEILVMRAILADSSSP